MKVADFNEYVACYQQSVYRFVYKMLYDEDDTKDVVQEAFMKLWEHGKGLQTAAVKSWLFTTAYRLCLACLKKRNSKSSDNVEDLTKAIETNPDQFNVESVVSKSLLLLTELQRSVLMLKDYEGYAYHEIATILDISEDSVKVHLFRARKKIKDYIKDLKYVI